MSFTLSDLPYAPDALAPFMSAETLDLHHGKHHRAYVNKLNEIIPGGRFDGLGLEDLVRASWGEGGDTAVFNNAAQHWNHDHFWGSMKPNGGGHLPPELERRIISDFGGVAEFQSQFIAQGVGQFGAGWVWLVEHAGKLQIRATSNAITPLVDGAWPVLSCDVWEHSYYVDYRNRRPDYIRAFLDHLVDWEAVTNRLED